jgi:rhodanese-related sulfurtransferase
MQVEQNSINKHNLSKAYTMVGGTAAWAQAGLPFEHDLIYSIA